MYSFFPFLRNFAAIFFHINDFVKFRGPQRHYLILYLRIKIRNLFYPLCNYVIHICICRQAPVHFTARSSGNIIRHVYQFIRVLLQSVRIKHRQYTGYNITVIIGRMYHNGFGHPVFQTILPVIHSIHFCGIQILFIVHFPYASIRILFKIRNGNHIYLTGFIPLCFLPYAFHGIPHCGLIRHKNHFKAITYVQPNICFHLLQYPVRSLKKSIRFFFRGRKGFTYSVYLFTVIFQQRNIFRSL